MFFNKNTERAQGPGTVEIVVSVVLSVTLGVLLGVLHLVLKPVEVTSKPPSELEPGQVYLLEGSSNNSKARQWTRKRQILADGNAVEVSFSEDELNAWITSATTQGPKREETQKELFSPERVNFRIQGGELQVGIVGKLEALGVSRELVFQTRGKFVESPDGFVFAANEMFVGSLPAHKIPGLTSAMMKRALAAQELPEDIAATWKKLKLVAIEDNVLRLVLP